MNAHTKDFFLGKDCSNRESEVAALVATGLSNKAVADILFITEKTVKFHLTNIYKKIHVKTRAQLIVLAMSAGVPTTNPVVEVTAPEGQNPEEALPVGIAS